MWFPLKRPTSQDDPAPSKKHHAAREAEPKPFLLIMEIEKRQAFKTFEEFPEILRSGEPRIAEDVLTSVYAHRDFEDFVKRGRPVATKFHPTTYSSLIQSYEYKWKPADDLVIMEGERAKRTACESKIESVQDAHQACGLSFYVMDDVSEKTGPPAGGSSLELDNNDEGLPEDGD
ncbi:uncharacterized protein LOC129585621 [Paramacrobiotus metropolitanus]|uniref:uncharacterized protein LOC129585621 n=1 Tax=Paramacrobiotus metropolitanus TaxID=2943436 RepID=UPI002445EFDE|nr:uncharacterized protein LOC129585621 [Paramacrobiotus metropolitanus]XP_055334346.1 uncharacterized protein LOC129585621 [Paramacrobiotus metropolitanus]XP_055334347.1 uncharacterized protein LOC129585621 [Paramacrobiotus metropolitanus]